MNKLGLTTLAMLLTSIGFSQSLLDTKKYRDAELFVTKKGYDV